MNSREFEFVSQMGTRYEDISCGVAATIMLLKAGNYSTPSFQEMEDLLMVAIPPCEKWNDKSCELGDGVYVRDITPYLDERKIGYLVISVGKVAADASWGILENIASKIPVMVGVDNKNPEKWGDGGHWILLSGYDEDSGHYTFYDSARRESEEYRRTISGKELKEDWDGYAIAITTQCQVYNDPPFQIAESPCCMP